MVYNDLPPLEKNRTCAVSGHRILSPSFNKEKLSSDLEKIINRGFNIFLIGMATGFDLACFSALLDLKAKYPELKLTAVIPCQNQSYKYTTENKLLYDKMVRLADYKVILFDKYENGCMLKRNDFLIANSSLLYAYYLNSGRGGTFYTIDRAKKEGIPVIFY